MNTPSLIASALPSERDMQLIRRKAAKLRADHVRSVLNRLATALTGRGLRVDERPLSFLTHRP